MKSCFVLIVGIAIGVTGCVSTSKTEKEPPVPRLSPTEMGVRTTSTGHAVAEVDRPPEEVFDITEIELRKKMKVTFVNRSIWNMEAQNNGMLYHVMFAVLTTGKTGLTVTAINRENKKTDYRAARKLADEILETIKAFPPAKR